MPHRQTNETRDAVVSVAEHPPQVDRPFPAWALLLAGLCAAGVGLLTAFWFPASLLICALGLSLLVGLLVARRGNALVVALALILFWLPFHTTISRFGISPQEVAVYGIWLVGLFLSPQGTRRWLWSVLRSWSPFGQFLLLIFALACAQSLLRIPHLNPLDAFNNLRQILLYPVLLALLVSYATHTQRCTRVFLQAFTAGGALFAVYALLLRLWGTDVANGAVAGRLGAEATFLTGYHPNNLGLYLALALAFIPAFLSDAARASKLRMVKLVAVGLGFALMGLALWLTYSRGALIAFLLGVAAILFLRAFFSGTRARLASIGIILAGMLALGAFVAIKGVDGLGRYAGLLDTTSLASDPNIQFRESLYTRALTTATSHLFTGTGLGSFAQGAAVPFSPHNTYLNLWVSIGLFGALAFVGILWLGIIAAARAAKRLHAQRQYAQVLYALGLVGALLAFLAQAFTETFEQQPRIAPAIWVLVACADGLLLSLSTRKQRSNNPESGAQHTPAEHPPASYRLPQDGQEPPGKPEMAEPSTLLPYTLRQPVGLESGPLPALEPLWKINTQPLPGLPREDTAAEAPAKAAPARPKADQRPENAAPTQGKSRRVAEDLVKRAPSSYIWNQLYTLWFFAANFLLSIILTRGLSSQDYGIYAVLTTIVSTLLFVFALGLEDAATVFVPRVLARDGQESAGHLMRRLLLLRLAVVGGVGLVITAGLAAAAPAFPLENLLPNALLDTSGSVSVPRVALMAAYLVGSSLVALENSFFAAMLKSRITFFIGGASQILNLIVMFLSLKAGYGADGAFAALGAVSWLTALAYLAALVPLARKRSRTPLRDKGELRKLAISAWLTNVTNGALGKQMDIFIMTAFAVSYAQIGYYNLAYQLTNIVGLLLISGLGGVGMATMSAALAAGGPGRLASIWRAALMLQILFAVPLQLLCLVRSDQIVAVLYGDHYQGAVLLFSIFLAFSIVGRLIGGGVQQSALYVVGRQRSVLVTRWVGFALNAALDLLLIPLYGPAGALLGTGFSQVWVGTIEYLLVRRHVPISYPLAFTWRVIAAATLGSILLLWWTPAGFLGLAASTLLFTVVMIAGLFTLRAGEAEDLQEMVTANPRLQKLLQALGRRLPRHQTSALSNQRGGV